MLSDKQKGDIQFCRELILSEVKKITDISEKLIHVLSPEIRVSIIYLEALDSYIKEGDFNSTKEAWMFMNDIKGIIEKIFYVREYLNMKEKSLQAKEK